MILNKGNKCDYVYPRIETKTYLELLLSKTVTVEDEETPYLKFNCQYNHTSNPVLTGQLCQHVQC